MSVELLSTSLKIEKNESFLSLDDYLNIAIVSNQNGYGYVSLSSKERIFYCIDKTVKDAKFSSNGVYTAAQFNDTDIEILNTKEGKRITQTTKFKSTKGTVILGFYFIASSLLIVTNTSLELYQITSTADTTVCKPLKDVKIKIQSYIYSSKSGILLSYGGDKYNSIQPFKFTNNYIEKLPKYSIECQGLLDINKLYITLLYGKTYCIYGDNTHISFYEINPETVYRTQVIKLILPGQNHIQFVDNLIIVHYNDLKVSVVYDLKMLKEDFPISAIPMVYRDHQQQSITTPSPQQQPPRITASSTSYLLQQRELQQQQQQQQPTLYSNTWKYVHPNYIFDTATGGWYEVRLNFDKVSHLLQCDNADLIPFLQQRSSLNAKQALLAHIKTIIEFKKESLEVLGKIFDSLNHDLRLMASKNNTLMLQKHLTAKKPAGSSLETSPTPMNRSNNSLMAASFSGNKSLMSNDDDEDLIGDINSRQDSNNNNNNNNSNSGLNIGSRRLNSSNGGLNNTISTSTVSTTTTTSFIGGNRSPSLTGQQGGNIRSTLSIGELNMDMDGNSSTMSKPMAALSRGSSKIIVNAEDLYEHVFNPIYEKIVSETSDIIQDNNKSNLDQEQRKQMTRIEVDSRYLIAIITEYLRSLNFSYCGISDKIFTLLLSLFINNNMFSQLHQFLQYHVVEDAESIAYKLLSISETYPPALQLSLDMFKRLNMPNVIISTLLEKKQVLLALRFMRNTKTKVDPELFFRTALSSGDNNLFFSVYKYFESVNQLDASNCEKYVKQFKQMFS